MIQCVIFRPAAVEDLVQAAAWYEEQLAGLGEELVDEILHATQRAAANPELIHLSRASSFGLWSISHRFPRLDCSGSFGRTARYAVF